MVQNQWDITEETIARQTGRAQDCEGLSLVYAIWDTATGNIADSYCSETAAFEDVRGAVTRFGRDYARLWVLARDEGDDVTAIAEGEALIDRAFGVISASRGFGRDKYIIDATCGHHGTPSGRCSRRSELSNSAARQSMKIISWT